MMVAVRDRGLIFCSVDGSLPVMLTLSYASAEVTPIGRTQFNKNCIQMMKVVPSPTKDTDGKVVC